MAKQSHCLEQYNITDEAKPQSLLTKKKQLIRHIYMQNTNYTKLIFR